ncbi:unnamed protein product [Penicillium salamii]|uniref:Fungal lipase-type domain-containing protein n=1 Tax=Penicillium salamii TaxID=1612424 RepID=A0A9W4K0I1_9EURO|nr:unnamed protein product [Penicillium salamii]CAG8047220.1 unnamed protein product [Penicillium salamii]CAG8110631.1 unnamed protein product [Penicillium salamii]CAG8143686.1 unnamed protein product [Penicillium salamii]CAG8173945.1 unnamed protein product [Penicillium salamii]
MFSSILRLGIILPAFITAVLASPVQLNRRDISSKLLDDFSLHAQFAVLAACDQNINGTRGELSCDQGPCDLVQAHDTEIIDNYHRTDNATGYIALDHTRKSIIVTFRGTITIADGDADKNIWPKVHLPEFCKNCYGHAGFWTYWKSAEDQVVSRLQQATKDNPDYSIAVAGHSLGGAVSTLAGTALRQKGFTLDIWTFGSPQVGNPELAQFITEQRKPVSVYRATNYRDGIPALPGRLLHYRHPSPEYWINQMSGHKVTTDVVEVIEGIDNTSGNQDHHDFGLNDNHGWYFGNVSVCAVSADQGK